MAERLGGKRNARGVALVTLLGLATGTPLSGAAPTASAWSVSVAPGACTLEHAVEGPTPIRLTLQTRVGSDSYRFAVAGTTLRKRAGGTAIPVTILLHGEDKSFERNAYPLSLGSKLGEALVVSGMGPDLPEAIARAASASVRVKGEEIGPFALPQAGSAVAAFRKCSQDQLIAWGADPSQFEAGGSMPVARRERDDWLSNSELIRMGGSADSLDAEFRVGVAGTGRIDACSLIAPADKQVEKLGCSGVMGKPLFAPAHDGKGKPVRGVATFEVHLRVRPG